MYHSISCLAVLRPRHRLREEVVAVPRPLEDRADQAVMAVEGAEGPEGAEGVEGEARGRPPRSLMWTTRLRSNPPKGGKGLYKYMKERLNVT